MVFILRNSIDIEADKLAFRLLSLFLQIHSLQVDFIWINRDQKSFEWFLTLLNQLEIEQSSHHGALENCIQTHLYMTAAQKKTDMKGIGLQVGNEILTL